MSFTSKYDFNFKSDKTNSFIVFVFGFLMYCITITFMSGIFTYQLTSDWRNALSGKLTIEFPSKTDGITETLTDKQKTEVINIVQSVPGVLSVSKIKEADLLKILEPWLYGTAIPDDFPFPTLFDVDIDKNVTIDLLNLTAKLSKISSDVRIHDHSNWYNPISKFSKGLCGFSILLSFLILMTVCSTIILITKKTLKEHHDIVKILQLIGANDKYISSQFMNYYLSLSMKGVIISIILSLFTILGITYITDNDWLSIINIQYSVISIIVPTMIVFVIMLTSKSTVGYFLKNEDWVD